MQKTRRRGEKLLEALKEKLEFRKMQKRAAEMELDIRKLQLKMVEERIAILENELQKKKS